MEFRLVPNQSKKGKYNAFPVNFSNLNYEISDLFESFRKQNFYLEFQTKTVLRGEGEEGEEERGRPAYP